MTLKNFKNFSTLVITLMLCFVIAFLTSSTYNYVFNYRNEKVIYNGNRESNKVSLMINVYWGTEYLDDMLDVLDSYNVKCTFFVGGKWVEKEPEMLNKIYSKGHEIANHGYLHKDQEYLDYDGNFDEININHQLVKQELGIDMNLFAPPSGSFCNATLKASNDLGYKTIMWSKDTIDWRDHDADLIFSRATKNVTGGELILMHPTDCTLRALPLILEYYKMTGLSEVIVSECLK